MEQTIRQELAAARRLHGDDHQQVASLLQSLGSLLLRTGDLAGAEAAYREGFEIAQRIFGADHREAAAMAASLASAKIELGQVEEAESLYRSALPTLIDADEGGSVAAGAWQPGTMFAAYRLGLLLDRRRAYGEAEELLRPAVAAASRSVKEGDRYEWMRWALASQLSGVLVHQSAEESAALEGRTAKLREAMALAPGAAERLLELAPKMGPRNRAQVVPGALERTVELFESMTRLEPSPEHAAQLARWMERQREHRTGR